MVEVVNQVSSEHAPLPRLHGLKSCSIPATNIPPTIPSPRRAWLRNRRRARVSRTSHTRRSPPETSRTAHQNTKRPDIATLPWHSRHTSERMNFHTFPWSTPDGCARHSPARHCPRQARRIRRRHQGVSDPVAIDSRGGITGIPGRTHNLGSRARRTIGTQLGEKIIGGATT